MPPVVTLLENENRLKTHIRRRLQDQHLQERLRSANADTSLRFSAVLFLLGMHRFPGRVRREPCLIVNERSRQVRQPGDLCFPGGGIMPRVDPILAGLLNLPGSPLSRWPYWSAWRRAYPGAARRMALCLATGLRESLEEMRLNPFGITFLGPLPPEHLIMSPHLVFPVVGWLGRQKAFKPNGEVAKIVHLPLRDFFDPGNYALFRIACDGPSQDVTRLTGTDFISFSPRYDTGTSPLWGMTFRVVMAFLEAVFGFQPPQKSSLPVVSGRLERHYTEGNS